MTLKASMLGACSALAMTSLAATALTASNALAETLTIATVNNSDMIIMQELSSQWEKQSGHTLDWVVLEENVLRQRVTTDIATNGGSFDVITIGAYEAPIWGAQGWLKPLDDLGEAYNYDDIYEPIRNGLSANGTLYAVPFYAESSFTFYRKDLFEAAGIKVGDAQITYEEFAEIVAKVHAPDKGVYGTCQRGKAGWGENMAFVGPMVNAFGGKWFDMDWQPQLESAEWKAAVNYYVDLMNSYGPPGASSNGHNENRALFADGKCATWVDATSAAGYIFNPGSVDGRRQDRLLPGAEAGDRQRHRLVLGLGAGCPEQLHQGSGGQGLPRLVHFSRLREACGRNERLGRGASGHPEVDLRESGLSRCGAFRRHRREIDPGRQPG